MLRKTVLLLLALVLTGASFAQTTPGFGQRKSRYPDGRIPDNKELVSKARSFYVHSDTFFMKREQLESSLLGRPEFKDWNLQVSGNEERADMIIHVQRIPFTNHFTYTVTDGATDTIVMAGEVDSLAGTVYGLIAEEIVQKMKAIREGPSTASKGPVA
ncbi:MAG TPA: hypothetical protein VNV88_02980 [Candidatus Solibacter sp.]|jgi:hypothetical protein|nr:hypothetical protein [Candidatus Solibacter sp.]